MPSAPVPVIVSGTEPRTWKEKSPSARAGLEDRYGNSYALVPSHLGRQSECRAGVRRSCSTRHRSTTWPRSPAPPTSLGFDAVLTPTGTHCEDAWLVTTALSQHTSRLRFLVAFRPGITNPTLAAQQAATFQRITGGRLLINIVTGGDGFEQRRFGDWLSHDERYARTDEFMAILRGAWSGELFDFAGWHYKVDGATVSSRPIPSRKSSSVARRAVAEDVAARHVDVYLLWGEPPAMARERIERVREKADAEGTISIRFGMRLHVITRDTEAEAWAEANRLAGHDGPSA